MMPWLVSLSAAGGANRPIAMCGTRSIFRIRALLALHVEVQRADAPKVFYMCPRIATSAALPFPFLE